MVESDNAILYGILTLILAVVALIMLQVNSNLRKLADDKEGDRFRRTIPFYRNKTYITLITLMLFVVGGFLCRKRRDRLGRTKDYQPEQPIYYSHKVHAGHKPDQLSVLPWRCLRRQAGKYSFRKCLYELSYDNHEYTGSKDLHREDGTEVNGTAEIQKIYD